MSDVIGIVAVAAFVLIGVVLLGSRLTNKTWNDQQYERERQAGTALGNAFLTTQAIFDSGARHALEQRMVERATGIESSGPPDPGEGSDELR